MRVFPPAKAALRRPGAGFRLMHRVERVRSAHDLRAHQRVLSVEYIRIYLFQRLTSEVVRNHIRLYRKNEYR